MSGELSSLSFHGIYSTASGRESPRGEGGDSAWRGRDRNTTLVVPVSLYSVFLVVYISVCSVFLVLNIWLFCVSNCKYLFILYF